LECGSLRCRRRLACRDFEDREGRTGSAHSEEVPLTSENKVRATVAMRIKDGVKPPHSKALRAGQAPPEIFLRRVAPILFFTPATLLTYPKSDGRPSARERQ
jgi:hypothetical protein